MEKHIARLRRSTDGTNKRKSISHVLNSPRKHFTRSKSKDKIIDARDTILRRKSKRYGPASESRIKSDGSIHDHLDYTEEDEGKNEETFVLKATAVNSMPLM